MLTRLFEDEFILAVSKESGLPSQTQGSQGLEGSSGGMNATAESEAAKLFPGAPLFLLHRLDTGTSGVLLFAKTEKTFEAMRLKFKAKEIKKHYIAFCDVTPIPVPSRILLPLAHHPKSKKRMIVLPEGKKRQFRGKPMPAETWIHRAEPNQFQGRPCLRLEVEITTGVMHQIRVHLSHSGFPILGDPLYGKSEATRLALHAHRVGFELEGFHYDISAPLKNQ